MSKSKGDRREREARSIYKKAGYQPESPNYTRYQNTDYWNLFDFMAVHPAKGLRFVQVKSNGTQGFLNDYFELVHAYFPLDAIEVDFLVCYDSKGWKLYTATDSPTDGLYTVAVDERKEKCNMGENVTEYLS